MPASVQHKVFIVTGHVSSTNAMASDLPPLGELLRAGWRVVTMHSAAHSHAFAVAAAGHAGSVVLLERAVA